MTRSGQGEPTATWSEKERVRSAWGPRRRVGSPVIPTADLALTALRWETVEATLTVRAGAAQAWELARQALAVIGAVEGDETELVAAGGTGRWHLQKAVVTVTRGRSPASLRVRAVAPEGLVRTHGAKSAVADFRHRLAAEVDLTVETMSVHCARSLEALPREVLRGAVVAGVVLVLMVAALVAGYGGGSIAAAQGCFAAAAALAVGTWAWRLVAERRRRHTAPGR